MEKPIIFSTEMVRAILDGRKTQTRRVIKPQAPRYNTDLLQPHILYPCYSDNDFGDIDKPIKCPYLPGDILWVRETWQYKKYGEYGDSPNDFMYKADANETWVHPWRSPYHMPREAARIFLKVKNVRFERLQEITEGDALAEGVHPWGLQTERNTSKWCRYTKITDPGSPVGTNRGEFAAYWDTLNAKRGYGWETNPWVWVIEFEKRLNEMPEGVITCPKATVRNMNVI